MLKTEKLKGKLALIHGREDTVAQVLISLAVRLQEFNKVIFIDTIQCFTPSYIRNNYHKHLPQPLERVFIARPHSDQEFEQLVNKLDDLFFKTNVKIVIISSLGEFYSDKAPAQMKKDLPRIIGKLRDLTKQHALITIIGNINTPNPHTKIMNEILSKEFDKIIGV